MEKRCPNIDRQLLPVKLHYFLFMAALACVLPFRSVFAKQLGISATALGIIFSAVPFIKILTNPLLGFLLDYFKRFRLTLSVILIFLVVSYVAMLFIPPKTFMSQNIINVSEKNFHSKLTYFWTNESSESFCHPKFTLNSEYNLSHDLMGKTNSFTCDMQCSEPINCNSVNSIENEFGCNEKMKFQFKIFVVVSESDINVRLEKGMLSVFYKTTPTLLLFEADNAVATKFVSPSSFFENSSTELVKVKIITPKNAQIREKKFNSRNQTKEIDIKSTPEPTRKNEKGDVKVHLRSVRKYHFQNEYTIEFPKEEICMNYRSNRKLDCETSNCIADAKSIQSNLQKSVADANEFLSAQFWSFFLLMIISSVTLSAVIFMMDAVCYELLQDRRDKYGQQRLWGTVGWGLGALVGGCLNQIVTSDSDEIDYTPGFYLLAALVLIDLVPLYHLKVTDLKYSSHIWKDVCFLFSKINILYNIIVVFIIGVLSGFIWNYQFWFMEEIGSSQVLLGLSQTFECIFELPCFVLSGWIIQKIGHGHCNSVTLLCFGLRYLCFAVMHDPWWTLAAGILHGPTFGLFYSSLTMYAKNEAPPGTEATVQSLLNLCFEGIGVATGSLLGGVGLDKFGSRMSFTYAAVLSFILLSINIIVTLYFSKARKNQIQTKISVS